MYADIAEIIFFHTLYKMNDGNPYLISGYLHSWTQRSHDYPHLSIKNINDSYFGEWKKLWVDIYKSWNGIYHRLDNNRMKYEYDEVEGIYIYM
jgi:hypothetical protein